MTDEDTAHTRTPVGVILVSAVIVLYGLFWLLTWILAGISGNAAIALLSMAVAAGVLALAYFLYAGHRAAWWLTIILLGGSTVWRLSLVARGQPDNLLNAVVGVLLLLLLISQHDFYRPTSL